MTPETKAAIERLKQLSEEATQGPWEIGGGCICEVLGGRPFSGPLEISKENMDAMVAARNALPFLIEAVEAADVLVEYVEEKTFISIDYEEHCANFRTALEKIGKDK